MATLLFGYFVLIIYSTLFSKIESCTDYALPLISTLLTIGIPIVWLDFIKYTNLNSITSLSNGSQDMSI